MRRTGRVAALVEVAAVFSGMIFVFKALGGLVSGLPGYGALLQMTVFTAGTLAFILVLGRKPGDAGIVFTTFRPSFQLALVAYAVLGPAGMVFWLIDAFGRRGAFPCWQTRCTSL